MRRVVRRRFKILAILIRRFRSLVNLRRIVGRISLIYTHALLSHPTFVPSINLSGEKTLLLTFLSFKPLPVALSSSLTSSHYLGRMLTLEGR